MAVRTLIFVGLASLALPALAADPPAVAADPSTEMRSEMAAAHRRMADCLESERPMGECRSEMMRSCRETMGEGGCPMMGHGPMGEAAGHGRRGHGMKMKPDAKPPAVDEPSPEHSHP